MCRLPCCCRQVRFSTTRLHSGGALIGAKTLGWLPTSTKHVREWLEPGMQMRRRAYASHSMRYPQSHQYNPLPSVPRHAPDKLNTWCGYSFLCTIASHKHCWLAARASSTLLVQSTAWPPAPNSPFLTSPYSPLADKLSPAVDASIAAQEQHTR